MTEIFARVINLIFLIFCSFVLQLLVELEQSKAKKEETRARSAEFEAALKAADVEKLRVEQLHGKLTAEAMKVLLFMFYGYFSFFLFCNSTVGNYSENLNEMTILCCYQQ